MTQPHVPIPPPADTVARRRREPWDGPLTGEAIPPPPPPAAVGLPRPREGVEAGLTAGDVVHVPPEVLGVIGFGEVVDRALELLLGSQPATPCLVGPSGSGRTTALAALTAEVETMRAAAADLDVALDASSNQWVLPAIADRGARRIGLVEIARHHRVDRAEVGEVGQVDGELDRIGERAAGRLGDRLEVVEHAHGLRLEALHHLSGRGVEADLAGQVDRVANLDRL